MILTTLLVVRTNYYYRYSFIYLVYILYHFHFESTIFFTLTR